MVTLLPLYRSALALVISHTLDHLLLLVLGVGVAVGQPVPPRQGDPVLTEGVLPFLFFGPPARYNVPK